MLKSNQKFIEKIHDYPIIQSGQILVSFDVTSLSTNVPIQETISIIADHIFDDKNLSIADTESSDFIKLL